MDAPTRVLKPVNLNRQISSTFFAKSYRLTVTLTPKSHHYHRGNLLNRFSLSLLQSRNFSSPLLPLPSTAPNAAILRSQTYFTPTFPIFSRLGFLFSLSSSTILGNPPFYGNEIFNSFKSEADEGSFFHRYRAFDPTGGHGGGFSGGRKREVAAVILGWLGARPKHLKRYAELYTSRGVDAITFVVPVRDALWFDFGGKVENRIQDLAKELISWLSKDEGRDRRLIFHTFSNTGWLVYGAILNHLRERPDLIERIGGCIIDSGPDPELNPKVWAAGFATALLKKRNTTIYPLPESTGQNRKNGRTKLEAEDPWIFETVLLLVLEKFFTILFKLPDVNRRLSRIIEVLSEYQPACPQLYLYSTADKVIPYQAVESFMEHQRTKGKTVMSFNFGSSSHVDHYRAFSDVYSSQVNTFLTEVLAIDK